MPGTAAIFVDGAYLDKVLLKEHPRKRINYSLLVKELAQGHEILRTYYYHCMPYRGPAPTPADEMRYQAMQKFITVLKNLPRFDVRLGRLVMRGTDAAGNRIFQQKRVDTMIGVDMALVAAKGKITHAVVVSGDSDMVPAVEAAKSECVIVSLWHGSRTGQSRPSTELYEACDDRYEITAKLIDGVLRT